MQGLLSTGPTRLVLICKRGITGLQPGMVCRSSEELSLYVSNYQTKLFSQNMHILMFMSTLLSKDQVKFSKLNSDFSI